MRNYIRNIILFLSPFLFMLVVNEIVRVSIVAEPYTLNGKKTMNSSNIYVDKCSWACHNSTSQICKTKHVKVLKPYYKYTDLFYFGIISLLRNTGNYGAANIFFLVLLLPFLIWFFIIKSLSIQSKINKYK